ncbi:hypothetical protein [Pseudomonas sp. NBRC 111121]|uniref:hypothetical protein n=1 Tax=Pseudomonas sp. NBRC 111121 TaxID=1661036 RepID=UPI000A433D3E|nr:hypothetical protein [Pseudomonas sp. NBRC 111121]
MTTAHATTPDDDGISKVKTAKNGKKFYNYSRHALHTVKALTSVFYYLISDSEHLIKKGIQQRLPTIIRQNLISLPCPSIYYGKPEYEQKKNEYCRALAKAYYDFFIENASPAQIKKLHENAKLDGSHPSHVKMIEQAFLSFSHVLTLSPPEAARLSEAEQVKLLFDMQEYFDSKLTNNPTLMSPATSVPHIKYDPATREYKSHLHIELGTIDFNKKKLNMHMFKERMNMILIDMENHPYFGQYLDKTNTLAAERKFKPKSDEEKELFINLINDVLGKGPYDINKAHRAFIDKGVTLHPKHELNKLKDVIIEYQGRKVSMKHLHERSNKTITLLTQYYELKDLATPAKKHVTDVMDKVKQIIVENQHLKPEQFIGKLDEEGIRLLPNINKNGVVKGYSVYIESINDDLKLSTIFKDEPKACNLPFDMSNAQHVKLLYRLKKQTTEHMDVKIPARAAKKAKKAERVAVVAYGQHMSTYRVRRMMYQYTTIDDYMNEPIGGKYSIALRKNYHYANGEFINRRSNRTEFRVTQYTPEKSLSMEFIGTNEYAAKALIQMYLENGFKGIQIGQGGSIEQSRKLWRAAMTTAGPEFKVLGYQPTTDDLKWLHEQKAEAIKTTREQNQKAIATYAAKVKHQATADPKYRPKPPEFKSVANQWMTAYRDPLAYAFVDLLKAGLNPMMVMTKEPEKAPKKATEDEMRAFYSLILKTVRNECPEHLIVAETLLQDYSPTPQPKPVSEPAVKPPVEPKPDPVPKAEPVAKPRTAADVVTEHARKVKQEQAELQRLEELKRQEALKNPDKYK